mmetsp:Transcript_16582/g.30009  ORF Transcript_16582/g.30009 Transcript_16582/m.30009 type:complete len:94 (-) Transcript_16582:583-864(-)
MNRRRGESSVPCCGYLHNFFASSPSSFTPSSSLMPSSSFASSSSFTSSQSPSSSLSSPLSSRLSSRLPSRLVLQSRSWEQKELCPTAKHPLFA